MQPQNGKRPGHLPYRNRKEPWKNQGTLREIVRGSTHFHRDRHQYRTLELLCNYIGKKR